VPSVTALPAPCRRRQLAPRRTARRPGEESRNIAEQALGVELLDLRPRRARVHQEVVHEPGQARDLAARQSDRVRRRLPVLEILLEQFQVDRERVQRVPDLVREVGCQLPSAARSRSGGASHRGERCAGRGAR